MKQKRPIRVWAAALNELRKEGMQVSDDWHQRALWPTLDSLKLRAGFTSCRDRSGHREPHAGPATFRVSPPQASFASVIGSTGRRDRLTRESVVLA